MHALCKVASAFATVDGRVGAGDMIAEGTLAIEMAATATDIELTIHPHPTLSETVMQAAEVFFGTSTDLYRPKR